jgi:hypothetical protein
MTSHSGGRRSDCSGRSQLVTTEIGCIYRRLFDESFAEAGVPAPKITAEVGGIGAIAHLVAAGAGLSLVPRLAVGTPRVEAHHPVAHDLHGHATEPGSIRPCPPSLIDASARSRRAWLASFVSRVRSRSPSPSKSDRKQIAEPIANLRFAPSIQIRRLLGIPRVSIIEDWYYT